MIPENDSQNSSTDKPFPFRNLFLIKGYVTGNNSFWMYLLGIFAAFIGYATFQMIVYYPLLSKATANGISLNDITANPNILFNPDAMSMNRSLMLAIMGGMFVFCLLFFWVVTKKFQQKALSSIITGFENIRWKRYFFAFGIWGALLVGYTVIGYLMDPEALQLRFDATKFALLFLVALLLIPIQTATEEILFRGYLMQGFGLLFKNGIAPLIITSVLFGLLHASNPEVKAHGFLLMMPYFILFGAFLGLLTLLDEGAELAMGIHFANNLFSCLLICSKNSVLQTDAIFYTTVEDPRSEIIGWAIMAVICFFILYKKYKLSNWKLLIR